jgi:replicative DNA helicase
MNKMNNIEKLFGQLFVHDTEKINKIFPLINPEWFTNQNHKLYYQSISELVKKGSQIDMFTIVDQLRQKQQLRPEMPHQISQLANESNFINIESLLNEINHDFLKRQMSLFVQNFGNEINSPNGSVDKMIELMDSAKKIILNDETKELNNVDHIFNVIELHNKVKNGEQTALEIGFDTLKQNVVLEPVDMMVVGGRPAMGKTAWMISAIKKLAFDQNKKIAVFSLEMSNVQIMRRMLANICEIDSNKMRFGNLNQNEMDLIFDVQKQPEWNNVHFFEGSHTILDITKKLIKLKNTTGCDAFFVDYLQKIIPEKSENRYLEVTRISNELKRLSMQLKIPSIALAQLSREGSKLGARPKLTDLKESGEIEQDASIVAFLHRPEYYGTMTDDAFESTENIGEFIVGKNRDGEIGIHRMDVDLKFSQWNDAKNNRWNISNESNPDQFIESNKALNDFQSTFDETPF